MEVTLKERVMMTNNFYDDWLGYWDEEQKERREARLT